jgi:hypothetical protein
MAYSNFFRVKLFGSVRAHLPPFGRAGRARGWSRFCKAKSLLAHATWIEAEIPQDLHGQIRGIGAESPIPAAGGDAPKFLFFACPRFLAFLRLLRYSLAEGGLKKPGVFFWGGE